MRVALCFACNQLYMPLCKGLVLSLNAQAKYTAMRADTSLHFIDIGCSEESLRWLMAQGAQIHNFDRQHHLPDIRPEQAPPYADAQLCRPFLPELVPGYELYIWIDCDFWVQAVDSISELIKAARTFAGKMVICPELHYGYIAYRNERYGTIARRRWYKALYNPEIAESLCWHPMLNSGFFALNANSALWKTWGAEIAKLYALDLGNNAATLHYAEQIALNYVLYTQQKFVLFDPIFNYGCAGASVLRNDRGMVVVGCPPFTPVKGVHLLAFSHYGKIFLKKGLLYNNGSYLSREERIALTGIVTQ